jgi:hypothetical protein
MPGHEPFADPIEATTALAEALQFQNVRNIAIAAGVDRPLTATVEFRLTAAQGEKVAEVLRQYECRRLRTEGS